MSKKNIPVFRATAAYIDSTTRLEMWADLMPGVISVDAFGNRPGIRFSHSNNVREALRNPSEVVATRLPFEKLPIMAVFIANSGAFYSAYLKVGRSTAVRFPNSTSELPESNFGFDKVRMARETETIPVSANVSITTGGHISDLFLGADMEPFDFPLMHNRCPESKFVKSPADPELEAELQSANAKPQPAPAAEVESSDQKKAKKGGKSKDRRPRKANGITKLQKKAARKAESAKKKLAKSTGKRVA